MPEQGMIPNMDVTEGTLQVDGTVPHPPARRKNVPPIFLSARIPAHKVGRISRMRNCPLPDDCLQWCVRHSKHRPFLRPGCVASGGSDL